MLNYLILNDSKKDIHILKCEKYTIVTFIMPPQLLFQLFYLKKISPHSILGNIIHTVYGSKCCVLFPPTLRKSDTEASSLVLFMRKQL